MWWPCLFMAARRSRSNGPMRPIIQYDNMDATKATYDVLIKIMTAGLRQFRRLVFLKSYNDNGLGCRRSLSQDTPKQTERMMKVLMVLTSHDQLGNTGRKTGFWLEELAAPYYVFKDAGAQITLASPKGGRPPLDPKSQDPSFQTDITRRFEKDTDAERQLDKTVRLESVKHEDYDTVFYPGGHGPMWDLAEDPNSVKLIESFLAAGKPVALVCHAPSVLRHVKTAAGKPLVEGKMVTGFTDGEEADVGLTKVVPFLVEDELLGLGATFSKVKNCGVHVVTDGLLITGQNPASSGPTAKVLIDALKTK